MIVVEFTVELASLDPFNFDSSPRSTFPLSWGTPGDSHLASYLSLAGFDPIGGDEVAAYAWSFAQRNRLDVLETAFDINMTLFREFQYRPGTTTVSTPTVEFLRTRQGVCQDFASLFISLARHLQIPARYVCGYLNPRATSGERPEATHAWVQLFLPGIGWRDFDPTNGALPTDAHVLLACGPSYRDAAPIWGTLYSPAMVKETMSVVVSVASALS